MDLVLREPPVRSAGRTALLIVVMIAVAALDLHQLINNAPISRGVDFGVFERASRAPAELVYQIQAAPFAYPPTALLLMKPLTSFGYWGWTIISAVAFALAVSMVAGRKVAALSFISPAAIKGLIHGQSAMPLSTLLFFGLRFSPLVGGCLWGVAASVKPQLMLFAPLVLMARRDWPMLAAMAFGCLLTVVASIILLDPILWRHWINALDHFNDIVAGGRMIRAVTPAGVAGAAGLPMMPFVICSLALAIPAVLLAAPRVQGEQLIALMMAASLAVSPYAHSYDAIALLPACVALMLRGPLWAAIPAAMIFIGTPLMTAIGLIAGLAAAGIWAARAARSEAARPAFPAQN